MSLKLFAFSMLPRYIIRSLCCKRIEDKQKVSSFFNLTHVTKLALMANSKRKLSYFFDTKRSTGKQQLKENNMSDRFIIIRPFSIKTTTLHRSWSLICNTCSSICSHQQFAEKIIHQLQTCRSYNLHKILSVSEIKAWLLLFTRSHTSISNDWRFPSAEIIRCCFAFGLSPNFWEKSLLHLDISKGSIFFPFLNSKQTAAISFLC